jgi:MinD superfamily P-loop ATPase
MIISVASGKGGTGKTTIAVNLALTLAETEPVCLMDCDVEEPNAHLFLKPVLEGRAKVTVPVPVVNEEKCTGCGMSRRHHMRPHFNKADRDTSPGYLPCCLTTCKSSAYNHNTAVVRQFINTHYPEAP